MSMGKRNRLSQQKQASVDDSYLPSFNDNQTNPDSGVDRRKGSLPTFASSSPSKQGRSSYARGGKSTAQPGHRRSKTGMSVDNTNMKSMVQSS